MRQCLLLIFSLILYTSTLSAQSSLLNKVVEIESTRGTVGSILSDIGRAGEFTFSYGQDIPQSKRIRLSSNRNSVGAILDEILGSGVYYVEYGNKLLLKKQTDYLGDVIVKGKVVDKETREALPGVTIYLPGTDPLIGVVTDMKGYFHLEVPAGLNIIQFSSIGYKQKSLRPGEDHEKIIEMDPMLQEIDELVIEYFTLPVDKSINFSQGYISGGEIDLIPLNSIDEVLQGSIPGIHAVRQTGMPGANIQVKVRGNHSLINSEPIYYLDGHPIQRASIEAIAPKSIASIDVLKDASGTAIYGASAGNGVVLFSSRREREEGFHASFEYYTGIQKLWKQYDLLNGTEFKDFYQTVFPDSIVSASWDTTYQMDWLNDLFHEGNMEEYHLSLSGKKNNSNMVFDLGYFDHSAMIKELSLERYSVSLTSNHQIGSKLSISQNIAISYMEYKGIKEGSFMSDYSNTILNSLLMLPFYPPGDSSPPNPSDETYLPFPTDDIELTGNLKNNEVILGSVKLEYDITDHIAYEASVGLEVLRQNNQSYTNSPPIFVAGPNFEFYNNKYRIEDISYHLQQSLNYSFDLPDEHQLVNSIGYEYESVQSNWIPLKQLYYDTRENFYLEKGQIESPYYQDLQYKTDFKKHAVFGSIDYNFRSKYFLNLSIRRDAISFPFNDNIRKLSSFFPSVAFGWIFSDEDSCDALGFLEYGKLRSGIGKAGNSPKLNYSYYAQMMRELEYLIALETGISRGMKNSALLRQSSEQFYWENKTSFNIGLDMGMFKNKLFVTLDYYLSQLNMGEQYPADNPLAFISELSQRRYYKINYPPNARIINQGVELDVNYKETYSKLTSNLGFHVTYMRNKIKELADLPMSFLYNEDYDLLTAHIPGHPAGSFYGYQIERLFTEADVTIDGNIINQPYVTNEDGEKVYAQANAQAGDYKFADLNGDGILDQYDKTILGNPLPDFTFGFDWHLQFMNFDLTVNIQGSYGNEIFNATKFWLLNPYGKTNWSEEILGSYRSPLIDNGIEIDPGNTDTDLHRIDPENSNQNLRVSDFFIEDGSYIRLKNLQLGYTINPSWSQKIFVKRFRVYLSAKNLYTLTRYSGLDPEIGGWGVDCGIYPQPRTYLLGVNLDF